VTLFLKFEMKKIKFFLTMVESSGWVGRRRVRNGRIGGRRSEGKGGVKVYEAYEVKRRKITLSFTSPGKDFFFVYDVFTPPGNDPPCPIGGGEPDWEIGRQLIA